jgi:hypothetical protein
MRTIRQLLQQFPPLLGTLVVVLVLIQSVAGQASNIQAQCQAWNGAPSACSGYLSTEIFIPYNGTQSYIAQLNDPIIEFVVSASPPFSCKSSVLRLLCNSIFMNCFNYTASSYNITETLGVPQPLCRSVCDSFKSDCQLFLDAFSEIQQYIPSCNATVPGTDVPMFLPDGQTYSIPTGISGYDVNVTCYSPPSPSQCLLPDLLCAGSNVRPLWIEMALFLMDFITKALF